MRRNIVLGIILVVSAVIFVWGARQQSSLVNTNMYEMDQSAYMLYAINLAETNFTYVGDRNRMPLYPMLMSFFYKQGMSDEVFFERGKKAGIAIGLIGILVTFLLFKHVSNTMEALTGTLVAAFTMFAYKAPYFQAEVLFYPISLFLFYLLLSLVKKPKIKTAILAGFVGGIGHLTKASVLPAVLVASVIVLLRGVISHWRKHRNADKAVINLQESNALWKSASNIVVLLFCFHLVIYPYIRTSKERFGRYYYNVNSTFYMWYDSWEEAELGTKAHGDRQCWPDMPSEDIPSFK